MSDLWFEVGEFVRRWWKVGLPVVVLAIVVPIGLVVAGGEGEDESADVASAEPPYESPIGPSADEKDEPGKGKRQDERSQGKEGGSRGGAERSGAASDASQGPVSPYGPPGKPVGRVAAGAPLSANQQAVARTLSTFIKAIARGNGNQACAQLSPEGRERAEREVHQAAPETRGTPCEGAIVLYQGTYRKSGRNPSITDVQVAGNQATANGPPGKRRGDLGKYDNVWLIDNYGWD